MKRRKLEKKKIRDTRLLTKVENKKRKKIFSTISRYLINLNIIIIIQQYALI